MSAGAGAPQDRDVSPDQWARAILVAQLFAADPAGFKGVLLRSAAGPVRDCWLDYLRTLLAPDAPVRRLPAGIADDRLIGGIDLPATLAAGRPVFREGVLVEASGGIIVIPMAERLSVGAAARIAAALDWREVVIERDGIARRATTCVGVVALDESAGPDEGTPEILAGRLTFIVDLQDVRIHDAKFPENSPRAAAKVRESLPAIKPVPVSILEALASTAAAWGIDSLVAPLQATHAARILAIRAGRDDVIEEDAVTAARMVLAPRARTRPAAEQEPAPETPDEPSNDKHPEDSGRQDETQTQAETSATDQLEDVMHEAVAAALPAGLLESLGATKAGAELSRRNGTGATLVSLQRGRPAGVRMGPLRSGARLALVDTLRAAAPWQSVRRAQRNKKDTARRIEVRREDFRTKKFVERRESTIIFCVDASGSAAFHRLAEAKGAVELLLSEAYVARTYAALIAFRGTKAEILLPPSRSLTRAKTLLSCLPGGGGTPLAAGIDAAVAVARGERAKGRTPLIVFLTDGQANIARDGTATRTRAHEESLVGARSLGVQKLSAIFIDTAPRPREQGPQIAGAMGARYLALPRVEAANVRDFVRDVMP